MALLACVVDLFQTFILKMCFPPFLFISAPEQISFLKQTENSSALPPPLSLRIQLFSAIISLSCPLLSTTASCFFL